VFLKAIAEALITLREVASSSNHVVKNAKLKVH